MGLKNSFWGSEYWGKNTKWRAYTGLVFFVASLLAIATLWHYRPSVDAEAHRPWAITWCLACSFLGLGFRTWQWRFDAELKDKRKDENDVPPPFPAYYIDYPIIVAVNSIFLYVLLVYVAKLSGGAFILAAIPAGFYLGSIVKLMGFKWLS